MRKLLTLLLAFILTAAPAFAGNRTYQAYNENIPFTASGYYPTTLGNVVGVWDAMVSVTTGTTNVTEVTDVNGGGSLTATSTNGPAYEATGLNGKPTYDFTSDYLLRTSFPSTGDLTFVMVHQPDNYFTNLEAPFATEGAGLYAAYHASGDGVDDTHLGFGQVGTESAENLSMSHHLQPEVIVITATRSTGAATFWTNGIKTSIATGTPGSLGTETTFTLGAFSSSGPTFPYHGKISHMAVYNAILTDAQITNVSKFLMNQYSIHPRTVMFVAGHSGNTGYNIADNGGNNHNEALSWPYQLMTTMATAGSPIQVIMRAISGSAIEDQDSLSDTTIDTMTVPYRARTILTEFGCANNINGDDASVATKLIAFLEGRRDANKYDDIAVISEMPGFDSGTTDDILAFNAVIRDTPSSYTTAGMTHFVDLQTISNFENWTNFSAASRSDNIHPTETMAGEIAAKVKTVLGL